MTAILLPVIAWPSAHAQGACMRAHLASENGWTLALALVVFPHVAHASQTITALGKFHFGLLGAVISPSGTEVLPFELMEQSGRSLVRLCLVFEPFVRPRVAEDDCWHHHQAKAKYDYPIHDVATC